jgi:hypothetical protein
MANPSIPQFNPYTPTGSASPFLFNKVLDPTQANELNTAMSIQNEFQYLHGTDIVFMPRTVGTEESVFGEYLGAEISKGYPLRAFVEEMEAWGGGGDMFSKMGIQITDEMTVHTTKALFISATSGTYPKQGDLIYVTKAQKLYQINGVEDEAFPGFYLFGQRTGYKMSCKMFSYNHEEISQAPNTGIPAAIIALDSLLADTDTGALVTLNQKDIKNSNKKIEQIATNIVDESEADPLG